MLLCIMVIVMADFQSKFLNAIFWQCIDISIQFQQNIFAKEYKFLYTLLKYTLENHCYVKQSLKFSLRLFEEWWIREECDLRCLFTRDKFPHSGHVQLL